MADLTKFEMTDEMIGELHVKNPNDLTSPLADLDENGEVVPGTELIILMMSPEAPKYREKVKAAATRNEVAKQKRMTRPGPMGSEAAIRQQIDEMDSNNIEIVAIAVVGWRNLVLDGQAVAWSEANAMRLLTRLPWLLSQCQNFMAQRGNFTGASSTD